MSYQPRPAGQRRPCLQVKCSGECLRCKHGKDFGVLGGFQCRVCSGIGHRGNLSVNTAGRSCISISLAVFRSDENSPKCAWQVPPNELDLVHRPSGRGAFLSLGPGPPPVILEAKKYAATVPEGEGCTGGNCQKRGCAQALSRER